MNLPEDPIYENGIYQLEITDPVQGGAGGIDNRQAKQLANRTNYLKTQQDLIQARTQIATMTNVGVVKPDGSSISIAIDGTISVDDATSTMRPGSLYWQLPGMPNPNDLYVGTIIAGKWQDISSSYEGTTFRVAGDLSNAFESGVQRESVPNITARTRTDGNIYEYSGAFYSENTDLFGTNAGTGFSDTLAFNASRSNPAYGLRNEVMPANETIKIWRLTGTINASTATVFWQYDRFALFVRTITLVQDELGFIGFNPNRMTTTPPTVYPDKLPYGSSPQDIVSNVNARWGFTINIYEDRVLILDKSSVFTTATTQPAIAEFLFTRDVSNMFTITRQMINFFMARLGINTPSIYDTMSYEAFVAVIKANAVIADRFVVEVVNKLSTTGNIAWLDKTGATRTLAQNATLNTVGDLATMLVNFIMIGENNMSQGLTSGRLNQTFTLPAIPPLTAIAIGGAVTVAQGQDNYFTVTTTPPNYLNAVKAILIWNVQNVTVATAVNDRNREYFVTSAGTFETAKIHGVLAGTTTVTASFGGITSNSKAITVNATTQTPVVLATLALQAKTVNPIFDERMAVPTSIPINGKLQLAANWNQATNRPMASFGVLVYTSSNNSVITVNSSGVAIGISAGTSQLRVQADRGDGTIIQSALVTVTVTTAYAPPPQPPVVLPFSKMASDEQPDEVLVFNGESWESKSTALVGKTAFTKQGTGSRKLLSITDELKDDETLLDPTETPFAVWSEKEQRWITDEQAQAEFEFEQTKRELLAAELEKLVQSNPVYQTALKKVQDKFK